MPGNNIAATGAALEHALGMFDLRQLVVEQFADGLSNIIPDQIIKNYKLAKLSDSIKEVQFPEVWPAEQSA